MIVDINPEFGIELVLAAPYAYWLHTQGKLEAVHTTKGMKPFYFFCNNVIEKYNHRTVDNAAAGLNSLPNNWLHHNADALYGKDHSVLTEEQQNKANGQLDYSKWIVPPLKEHYLNSDYNFDKKTIVISNRYNFEHGHAPTGFFDIKCLYEIFNYLTEKNYNIIYKRPNNTEFPLDQEEYNTLQHQVMLKANVEGIGEISDYDLVKFYDNVFLIDDLIKDDYNKNQIEIFSKVDGFIAMAGGNSILASYFKVPVISYVTEGHKEARPDYFGENTY